jgi:hypothetical protein
MRIHRQLALAAALLQAPSVAHAASLSPGGIFANAAPLPKAIILGLLAAVLASVIVAVRKLACGPRSAGASAFVASLRLGGPIAGILGGAYAALRMSLGIANAPNAPTLKVLAPGFAEVAALVLLGFLTGVLAVVLNWAIEARVDRQVLRG